MPVFIDRPEKAISGLSDSVYGWVAAHTGTPDIKVTANGRRLRHRLHERPDVRDALPGFGFVAGVFATLDVLALEPAEQVEIELACDGETLSRTLEIRPHLVQAASSEQGLRAAARAKALAVLACPHCRAAGKRVSTRKDSISCDACGETIAQDSQALNLISEALRISSAVIDTDNVSSNPYPPEILALIDRTTARGGWVLDCGAGLRPRRMPNVLNVEIADYSSTDVLAVGESLPFADNSFDAALSLAVLEHVRDPFACARELLRVVRPGGEILAAVPFLQPVHGYPNHFYNMTQQGLINLFASGTELLELTVPPYGHPIFGVQWLLREYLGGLPDGAREEFGAMTIAEAAQIEPRNFLGRRPATMLDPKTMATIACLNVVQVRKL